MKGCRPAELGFRSTSDDEGISIVITYAQKCETPGWALYRLVFFGILTARQLSDILDKILIIRLNIIVDFASG